MLVGMRNSKMKNKEIDYVKILLSLNQLLVLYFIAVCIIQKDIIMLVVMTIAFLNQVYSMDKREKENRI